MPLRTRACRNGRRASRPTAACRRAVMPGARARRKVRGDEFGAAVTLRFQFAPQPDQVPVIGARSQVVGHGDLRQRSVGTALREFQHGDARLPAPAQQPAQPHARRQRLVHGCAIDHVAGRVPGLGRGQRCVIVGQRAIGVILDQRHLLAFAQRHQPGFFRVRHHAAQRILEVRRPPRRGCCRGSEGQVQRLDRQAMLRAGGDFQRAHAQAFQDLQQAEVAGRFHRDRVARPRDRAQRQVQRLDAAMRDDDIIGAGVDAVGQRGGPAPRAVRDACGGTGLTSICGDCRRARIIACFSSSMGRPRARPPPARSWR